MTLKKRKERTRRSSPTWVDWMILAGVVAALVFGWRYLQKRQNDAAPAVSVKYLLCLSSVDTVYADGNGSFEDLIPVGASVTSANGTAPLGTVSAVWTEPHVEPTVQKETVVFAEVPNRVDLYVEVRGSAVAKAGDGLRISDIRIAAGSAGDYRIGGFLANGAKVISVTKGADS